MRNVLKLLEETIFGPLKESSPAMGNFKGAFCKVICYLFLPPLLRELELPLDEEPELLEGGGELLTLLPEEELPLGGELTEGVFLCGALWGAACGLLC